MCRRESGFFQPLDELGDLVHFATVRRFPVAPLMAVTGPRLPDSSAHSSQMRTPFSCR